MAPLDYQNLFERETGRKLKPGKNLIRSTLRPDDTNASLSIDTAKGLWFDFGMQQGGTIYDYIMVRDGMTFPQAAAYIDGGNAPQMRRATAMAKPRPPAPKQQQSPREYFKYREIVEGGTFHSGNIIEQLAAPDYIDKLGRGDCFHSIYLHSQDIISYVKEHKAVAGYTGPAWCDSLYFDVDYKGGTLQENIGKAQAETKRLIQQLKSNGVSSFRIKFSGSKGFHCSINHPALSTISGFEKTPIYVRNLARKLSAGINCDEKIYSSTIFFIRSVNTINSKTGLYAIPLSEGELFTLSVDDILALAKQPRPQPKEFTPVRIHSRLLNEDCTVYADRCVFDCGPVFSKQELDTLSSEKNTQAIKSLFLIKKHFGGSIERLKNGKA